MGSRRVAGLGRRALPLMLLAAAAAASAHHSFAMFDFQREVTIAGTVKEFQWTNPHCFIQLLVPSENGPQEWSVEMTSPLHLLQNGWKPAQVRAGEQLTVTIHPLREGVRGGSYVRAATADGRPLDPVGQP